MARANSLVTQQPSYLIANNKPKSARYYLNGHRYHQVIGKFSTAAFFHMRDILNTEIDHAMTSSIHDKVTSIAPINKAVKKAKAKIHENPFFELGPLAHSQVVKTSDEEMYDIVKLSHEVIAQAKTVFPIDLFPDSVVLDRTKLNITNRTFFFSNETISIRIEDILNVSVTVGPFLGALTIARRIPSSERHFTVNHLWRKDAIRLKHIIQGYVIALHNEIECTHLKKDRLVDTLVELGHDSN